MASEPHTVATKCKLCGAASFGFVVTLGKFGKRNSSYGGKQDDPHEAVLGGSLCERCSELDEAAEYAAEYEERHTKNLGSSRLPDALREIRFAGFTHPEAVHLAERWGRGQIHGLCLTGDVGVGKSWLAAAATWQMLWRRRVRWVDTAQLVSALRASFSDESREQATRVVTGHGPAVFDDLDKAKPTEYVREVLFAAINARVAAGSPLLVTTNLPIKKLGDHLGKPLLSRLDGYCEVVEMVGPDRRVS